jgi:hypothetical protein
MEIEQYYDIDDWFNHNELWILEAIVNKPELFLFIVERKGLTLNLEVYDKGVKERNENGMYDFKTDISISRKALKYIKQNSFTFKIFKNDNVSHNQFIIKLVKLELETVLFDCCVCLKNIKQEQHKYFDCNHCDLCIDCYEKLKKKMCPLCRKY